MQAIGVALLLGLLWWQGKLETNANIQDQQGLLFYICIFWTTFSMWTTLMTFPMERQFLAKERAADMYRLSAYYLSSTIADGVAELVYPTVFLSTLYFMTGLRRSMEAFLYTLLATFLIGIDLEDSWWEKYYIFKYILNVPMLANYSKSSCWNNLFCTGNEFLKDSLMLVDWTTCTL